ncbi:MAG TPA: glycosyl hydrolase family 28 protein [Pyrinomonadaceae bacterium]|nr:glycosyl hydrolase family 28 protein [Pyrinomonadaceae bacterium]
MKLLLFLSLSLLIVPPSGINGRVSDDNSRQAEMLPGAIEPTQQSRKSITDSGAIADGKTLNTERIQSAINALASKGGGTLVVPKGVFLSGAIFLKPGVNLHLDEGAVIKGSTDRKDYPKMKTRIEGHFEEWLPALINGDTVDHLRISGSGTLDGNGAPFWEDFWARRRANPATTNLDVERPRLALIQNSKDVQISGITFKDSGFWNLHLYRCKNVVVESVRFEVQNGLRAPSSDGIDIDSCQYVTVRGCTFRVDDDAVCLKGSKGPFAMDDKDSPPVEHIRVVDCTFERGHGVLTIGSEATIVRDVVVERIKVIGPINLVRLKLRPDTPQLYEDIHYRDITLDSTGAIFQVRPWTQFFDLKGQRPPKSVVRNVTLRNIKGRYGSFGEIQGNPGQTAISDIKLENIDVKLKDENLKAVDVKNLRIRNVKVNGKQFGLKTS